MSDDGKVVYLRQPKAKAKARPANDDDLDDFIDHLGHQIEMHRDVIREAYGLLENGDAKGAVKLLKRACDQIEMGDDWFEDEEDDHGYE